MLKLFDQNNYYLRNISNYKELCIVSELSNGDKTLSFTSRKRPGDIQNEMYIETEKDRYVVKEVRPGDHATDYVCKLDLEALEATMFSQFTAKDQTAKDAAALAITGTGWRVVSTMTKKRSVQQFKKTPYEILLKIRDAFMCEIRFDTKNKIAYLEDEFGDDKGAYFRRGLNLRSIDLTLDSYDYYTRIIPIGANGIRIASINDGKDYVENYQYSNKIRTLIWEDTSYEDAETLKEDAEGKLEDLSKPKRSYSADVRDLAKLSGKYSILDFSLGDTILLVDEPAGINEKQRIVKMTEYPEDPEKNNVELSNTVLSWEELQDRLESAVNAWEDISNADGTVNGVYVHGVQVGDVVGIAAEINNGIDNSQTVKDIKDSITITSNGLKDAKDEITVISGYLTTVTARIGNVETTYLKATEAEAKYATIENLNATSATVQSIQGDYANFKTTTTQELAAHNAIITSLDANYLRATLANIDTANIDSAKVNDLYVATGLIKRVTISEGHVTNFLDAVQVDAASITAGTLIADRILLRGSNQSLVYALNNFGELTSTQVNTIDGYVLTDRTINADKIIAHSITANEITVENLIGANGWINLAQGTFNYGDALIWDGSRLTVNGVVDTDALTATGGTIGGWLISDTRLKSANASIGSGGACLFLINESSKPFIAAQNEDSAVTFQLARNGKLTATDATITGAITATSLTAQNVYYLHDSAGTKKAVLASSDAEFRDNAPVVNIGTGFTYVNIKNNLFANGQLMVGANGGGSLWCGNFYGGDIECSTINGGSYYNIELGSASTGGTAFTLPSAGTYLLVTGHNSTAGLNGIHIVRTSGNTAFKVAGAANITVTVSGTRLIVKTNGGTVNVYAVKLG